MLNAKYFMNRFDIDVTVHFNNNDGDMKWDF